MRKTWIIVVLFILIAIGAAVAWFTCGRCGGRGSLLADLDAEQTLGGAELRHLDQSAERLLTMLDSLPPAMRPPEASRSAVVAKLGADPSVAASWAAWGVDPERGVAIAADRRLMRHHGSRAEPLPVLLLRVPDRGKFQAMLGKLGADIKLGKQVGAAQDIEINNEKAWLGQRGDDLAVLPVPRALEAAEEAPLRANFEAFLRPSATKLASQPQFAAAAREAGDRLALVWLDSKQLEALETDQKVRADIGFFAALFPSAAAWLGDSAGLRIATSEAGHQALAEVVKPKRNPPKCARLLPKTGWTAARASVNLVDLMTGVGKLLPPSTPSQARMALPGATMGLAMIGLSYGDLTEALSGHACGGVEVASLLAMAGQGPKANPAWLAVIGVVDAAKADALLERAIGLAQGKGGLQPRAVQVKGKKGWQIDAGPLSLVVTRVDDAILAGPSVAAIEAAVDRKDAESLASTSLAAALDGDVVWATVTDAQPLIDLARTATAMGGKDAAAMIEKMTKDLAGQRYAGTALKLDGDGLLLQAVGDPLLQQSALGAVPILAAIAIPNFMRYTERAREVEARVELQQIARGAKLYFETPHPEAGSACQFPASAPQNPPQSCCDPGMDKDGDKRCDEGTWQTGPTWTALAFSPSGAMRYRFSFESSGSLGDAHFAARAYAEPGCSGRTSVFELTGHGVVGSDGACTAVIDGEPRAVD
ncbi:MAG: hypothetical protein HY902_17260 [Deltaproteobacteria bacterium]|nr:hypothetical protein [Deltaproteobacteria bacterium]